MTNVILKKGDVDIEITSKPTMLQIDKVLTLYRQFHAFHIGELELTLNVVKAFLVDKTKEVEIDQILNGTFGDDSGKIVDEWGKIVFDIFIKAQEAKKKSK